MLKIISILLFMFPFSSTAISQEEKDMCPNCIRYRKATFEETYQLQESLHSYGLTPIKKKQIEHQYQRCIRYINTLTNCTHAFVSDGSFSLYKFLFSWDYKKFWIAVGILFNIALFFFLAER